MPAALVYLLPALATVLWGANFNLAKHVLVDMDALAAAAARFDIAAAVMWIVCLARRERVPLVRHGVVYGLLGLIGISAFNILFFLGLRSTSAVNGALIMATNPLLTALFAVAFTTARLRPRQALALPIALAGVAFVVLGGGASLHLARGDLLLMAASISWGAYNVLLGEKLPRDVSGLANTTALMTSGGAVLTVVALAAGAPLWLPHADALESLLFMSVGGSVLAYIFWNAGIARVGAARAALFMNLVPVSSMVIAALEGQPPAASQLIGGAIVIAAVVLSSWPGPAALPSPVARRRSATPSRPCSDLS